MIRFNGRIALTLAAVTGLAVAGPLALAHGDAKNKKPGYESEAKSSAGLNLLGIVGGPELVGISNTEADSETSDDGASSSSSAESLEVAGIPVGPTASCEADGADSQGVDKDSKTEALVDEPVDPVDAHVKVLSASCDSRAVKSNNAHSSSSASVAEVSAGELEVAVLSSSSDAKTTSGNARSGSSFAVASVNDGTNETTVLGCTAESRSTNGSQSDSDGAVLLDTPLAGVPCPAESSSSHTRTNP